MENKSKIDVTIALPTWESKNIIWLQLESLCNQVTKFTWELIVCEEQTKNRLGKVGLMEYESRLKKVGCVDIKYIPLTEHTPLSKKWWLIASKAKGETFILAASDNYSPPNRIEISHNKLKNDYNWFDVKEGLFLNLITQDTATYVQEDVNLTSLFMATKTKFIKKLKGPWPKIAIDNWIRSQVDIKPRYRYDKPVLGIHTDGANKISIERKSRYSKNKYGRMFVAPKQELNEILTSELIDKVKKFNKTK